MRVIGGKVRVILIFVLLTLAATAFADDRLNGIFNLIRQQKFDQALQELQAWDSEPGEDPDMYIGYYNVYVFKGLSSKLMLGASPSSGNQLPLTSKDSGEVAGYLTEQTTYNPQDAQKALDYIDRGIELFPDRLDIIFGKAVFLGQLKAYVPQAETIVKAMEHSAQINHQWLWSGNEKLDDGKTVMLNAILEYTSSMVQAANSGDGNAKSKEALDALLSVGLKMKELYPDVPYGYNFLAIHARLIGDYDGAIAAYRDARTHFPDDEITLMNLAGLLMRTGETDEAKGIFQKVVDMKGQYADNAQQALDSMN